MTQAGPLAWRTGAGWLVLVGDGLTGRASSDAVDAAVLGWAIPNRPTAVLLTAGESSAQSEDLLENWADLGGSTGYIIPIATRRDARQIEHGRLIAEAGLIYLGDGTDAIRLCRALQDSPALDAIGQAFENGAPVVAAGTSAIPMGAWVAGPGEHGTLQPGWSWIPRVIIAPHFAAADNAEHLRRLLATHTDCLGLGMPDGTALALGPTGRVETIGAGQATVVVDPKWAQ